MEFFSILKGYDINSSQYSIENIKMNINPNDLIYEIYNIDELFSAEKDLISQSR